MSYKLRLLGLFVEKWIDQFNKIRRDRGVTQLTIEQIWLEKNNEYFWSESRACSKIAPIDLNFEAHKQFYDLIITCSSRGEFYKMQIR